MTLPEVIVPNVTTGEDVHSQELNWAYNLGDDFQVYNVKHFGAVGDGVTNDTSAIVDAYTECPISHTLYFPPGRYVTDPWTIRKSIRVLGAGRFDSVLIPRTNTVSPLVSITRTVDSGLGIYGNYGPSFERMGIDRLSNMAGACLFTDSSAAWLSLKELLCSGGTKSIWHHAPNSTFEDLLLWDCSDCMIDMDEFGLELHLRHVVMSANVTNLDTFIRLAVTTGGGLLGALYINDVTGNTSGGPRTVNNGLTITAPSSTEIPTFCEKLILDNINGGGPVVTLTNVATFTAVNSWFNGTNGCVKMDGCTDPHFLGNRYRGGTHTYEFGTGAVTYGFQSAYNEVATGPAYKVGGSNKPTNIKVDDHVVGATDVGQVTNDVEWFEQASRRTWGQQRIQGHIRQREAGSAPPSGYAVLTAGVATITHPLVQTNTRVRISRERVGTGAPGELFCSVADNVVGTSFTIRSTSTADNGGVYWWFVGDGD